MLEKFKKVCLWTIIIAYPLVVLFTLGGFILVMYGITSLTIFFPW